jgi:hypothetical protein
MINKLLNQSFNLRELTALAVVGQVMRLQNIQCALRGRQ